MKQTVADDGEKLRLLQQSEAEKSLLLLLSKDITSCRSKEDIQKIVSERLGKYFQFNEIMICLNNPDNLTHTNYIHTISGQTMGHPDFAKGVALKYYIHDGIYDVIQQSENAVIFNMHELMERTSRPYYVDFFYQLEVNQLIGFPVKVSGRCFGAVFVYVKEKRYFTAPQLELAEAVCAHISIAIFNVLQWEEIHRQLTETQHSKSRLEQENICLQEEMLKSGIKNRMVGAADCLKKIYQQVTHVAYTDSTVLIMGETGTGKELLAQEIHELSPRRGKNMVKVNCAALPAQLIESELFGHEKGSFTGAMERRLGKFELAANGTLFLDEIGDMPLDLQAKLLRAIQEKEIERVGGKEVIATDVRIIAATNRDLKSEVNAGRFRADLYYRINVFPITLPPLRERKEDLQQLITAFIQKYAAKFGKKITGVSPAVLKEMYRYDWPGNIRELENVMERALLMGSTEIITEIFLAPEITLSGEAAFEPAQFKTLEQNEREHIIATLKRCQGRVRGAQGAAALLNIPPTTLHSKMKKLGIIRAYQ